MKIRFTLTMVTFVSFLSIGLILTSCKKNEGDGGSSSVPTATTGAATMIGRGWATLNGTINAQNQIIKVTFEFDTTESYEYSIKGFPDTITGNTNTSVSANILHLLPNTKYYYRIKAASSSDSIFGGDNSFTTTDTTRTTILFNPDLSYGFVVDLDGNKYKTIQIGTQTWMAENLKAATFNDGTEIPYTPNANIWAGLSTPGYSWYNNDSVSFGAFYNWYAVDAAGNGGKNVCPTGWHVPTDMEWTALVIYLGGDNVVGSKIKETGTTHWYATDSLTTNETGFTAFPAGYRNNYGVYNSYRRYSYWWSSTDASSVDAYCRDLNYSYINMDRIKSLKISGFSVRCIKDEISGN
jgi:uncharacterized protein (TIGR02145 family)